MLKKLEHARAPHWAQGVKLASQAEATSIPRREMRMQSMNRRRSAQDNDTSAKPAAGHARPIHPADAPRGAGEPVGLGARHAIQRVQRFMRGVEESPDLPCRPRSKRSHRVVHPLILAHDMSGGTDRVLVKPLVFAFASRSKMLADVPLGRVTERADTEPTSGPLAPLHTLGILA